MLTFAQTNIQLYNQLLAAGYSGDDIARVQRAYEFAVEIFAHRFQASGRDFMAHSLGTASILVDLRQPIAIVCAGMVHNVYGSGDFGDSDDSDDSDDSGAEIAPELEARRERVRRAIGADAEAHVARFCESGRSKGFVRRAAERILELDEAEQVVILLRLADEADKVQLDPELSHLPHHKLIFERDRKTLGRMADALGFEVLARAITEPAEPAPVDPFRDLRGDARFGVVLAPPSDAGEPGTRSRA